MNDTDVARDRPVSDMQVRERLSETKVPRCVLRRRLCVLVCAMLAAPRGVEASEDVNVSCDNVGLGHLAAPSLSPGHFLRPNALFMPPERNPRGTWEADCGTHWANVFLYDKDRYLIDGEWVRIDATLSYVVENGISAGISMPYLGRSGGFADSAIENFHQALHMGQGHRNDFPRNRSTVEIADDGGTRTLVEGDAWNIGDASGFVTWQVTPGDRTRPSWSLQAQVSVPSGDAGELQGLGEPSVSMGMVLSKRLLGSPLVAFGGAGFFYCPAGDIVGTAAMKEEYSGLLGLECQYSRFFSLIVQDLSSSPVADDYEAFAGPTHELSVGFKWHLSSHGVVEFSIVENILTYKNSADFGAHFSLGKML